jgi:hypothetical protein
MRVRAAGRVLHDDARDIWIRIPYQVSLPLPAQANLRVAVLATLS